jgi:hypothetical protein
VQQDTLDGLVLVEMQAIRAQRGPQVLLDRLARQVLQGLQQIPVQLDLPVKLVLLAKKALMVLQHALGQQALKEELE